MTPRKPDAGKDRAFDGAVALDRLEGVMRTCRQVSAPTLEHGRDRVLIDADQAAEEVRDGRHALPCPVRSAPSRLRLSIKSVTSAVNGRRHVSARAIST
jgi:hypothetical protein